MHTLDKRIYMLAVGLSALAGYVDAIGFLQLGGYFVSFMTGNSTRLAVDFITGDLHNTILVSTILALFVVGTMLGVLVRHYFKTPSATISVLLCVTSLLVSAALCAKAGYATLTILLMTLAMGAENAVFQRNGAVVGLTYMTGTLVKIGQGLATAITGEAKAIWKPYLLLWLGLICGGIIGTIMFQSLGLHSIWIAAGWAATLACISWRLKHYCADMD